MLGKCLKYEIKAFARIMLPLIGVFSFTWVVEFLFLSFGVKEGDFLVVLMWILILPLLLFSMAGIPIVACLYGAKRYNDVMFSSKAYLMRPLPVRSRMLVISIFLNSVVWYIISVAMMALALALPSFAKNPSDFVMNFGSWLQRLINYKDQWIPSLFNGFLTMLFIELMIMLAVTFASKHNGSRLGFTFLYSILITVVTSFIHGMILGAVDDKSSIGMFEKDLDVPTIIFRSVLSVAILIYLLWYADKKADVRQ